MDANLFIRMIFFYLANFVLQSDVGNIHSANASMSMDEKITFSTRDGSGRRFSGFFGLGLLNKAFGRARAFTLKFGLFRALKKV